MGSILLWIAIVMKNGQPVTLGAFPEKVNCQILMAKGKADFCVPRYELTNWKGEILLPNLNHET